MIKPNLPTPGDNVRIMGIEAKVLVVEPQSDYAWRIELSSISVLGSAERWSIELPTDYHTITGRRANA